MEEISIVCLGDIQFEKTIATDPKLKQTLNEADIVFGNLENPLTTASIPVPKPIVLKTHPSLTSELKAINVKVVSLANNHICDYGDAGLFETIYNLKLNDIEYVGAGRNLDEALRVVKMELKGLTVGFMGVACTLPPSFEASENRPGVAPVKIKTYIHLDPSLELEQPGTPPFILTEPDEEYLKNVVEKIEDIKNRESLDLLIIGIHWGVPFQDKVLDYQFDVGKTLLQNGVDVIIGHHPHTLHGISNYDGKIIFYSLGNFVFHYNPPKQVINKFSKIMGDMQPSSLTVAVRILLSHKQRNIELIPVKIGESGDPRMCDLNESTEVYSLLKRLSHKLERPAELVLQENGIISIC